MRSVCAMLLLASVVACGGGEVAEDTAGPTTRDGLVVRIDRGGGLMHPDAALSSLPTVSVYGDGRVITQGPQIAIYPPPALPNLQQTHVTDEALERIIEAARDAGLAGADRVYENPTIADAPTTTFVFVDDDRRHVTSVEALGIGPVPGPDIQEQLETFQRRLTDLRSWLPDDAVSDEQPYEPEAMAVYVTPPADAGTDVQPNELAWPLESPPSTFGEEVEHLGTTVRCGVVTGDELDTLLDEARQATQITRWTSDGEVWSLVLRPLLPDESACPAAGDRTD